MLLRVAAQVARRAKSGSGDFNRWQGFRGQERGCARQNCLFAALFVRFSRTYEGLRWLSRTGHQNERRVHSGNRAEPDGRIHRVVANVRRLGTGGS
jgi:hypothetical protein